MRRALLALAVLAGVLVGPATVGPAAAGTISGACTSAKGVTVVVNFASLGGGTRVVCYSGAGSGTSGYAALHGAGFSTKGTAHDGEGFVCRINNKPSTDHCINTPPATAYWSYWYASNGGAWTYSNKGATNRHVIVGGFEGWVFHQGTGGNATPTSGNPTRPAAPKPKPKPKPKPSHSSPGSSKTGSSGSPSPGNGTASSGGQAVGAATDHSTGPGSSATAGSTAGSSGTSSARATSSATSTDASNGSLPGDGPAGDNSPLPLALGGLGVVALLVGAGVMVTRRRRPDGS